MHKVFGYLTIRNFSLVMVGVALAAAGLIFNAGTQTASAAGGGTTFPANAGTLGSIPDGALGGTVCGDFGAPRDVTFTVSGMSVPLSDVALSVTGTHTWVADLEITLIAPNGTSHTILKQTGAATATACGDDSDFGGPYQFNDAAPASPTFWAAAATAGGVAPVAAGSYRSSAALTGANTLITPAFAGIPDANGTWTMRVRDGGEGDVGSITAASLTLTGGAGPGPTGVANVDMNGDGKTDWVVVRGTDTPLTEAEGSGSVAINRGATSIRERLAMKNNSESLVAPGIAWYININGTGAVSGAQWGDAATDFLTPADFDGDGKVDIAVWRDAPAGQAGFYILNSSNGTFRYEQFGQSGDDPAIVGDYDGDAKADPAVYRCPALGSGDGQCFFYYRGSNNNPGGNVTFVPWGFGEDGDFFVNPGDFDGDGKYDYCIQRATPGNPTQGQFVLLKSGGGIEYISWGLSTDFILPGDYDGDGKSDFAVRRTVGSDRDHWILTRTGAAIGPVRWGIAGDVSAPGDYDGDGKQDLAVWRPSVDANQNYFWVLNSSNGSITQFEWGQCATVATCDFPAAGWYVH